jgi:hypothetical protein
LISERPPQATVQSSDKDSGSPFGIGRRQCRQIGTLFAATELLCGNRISMKIISRQFRRMASSTISTKAF